MPQNPIPVVTASASCSAHNISEQLEVGARHMRDKDDDAAPFQKISGPSKGALRFLFIGGL